MQSSSESSESLPSSVRRSGKTLPMESRTGRSNQCYNPDTGARIVAGCICLNPERTKVIMISSSAHAGKWVLPKGGHENDETLVDTAMRETWEEAGVEGVVVSELPVILDSRKAAPVIKGDFDPKVAVPKSEFHFFELVVDKMDQEWPESKTRQRRWCTYSEAKHELLKAKRPELVTALNSSSIVKDATEGIDDSY